MQKLTLLALALIGPAISGCSSTQSVTDRFLAATGATWRVAGAPMVFERTEARFSRSARDYTYIGPVALNRRGTYDYFLWVGIASTLDRGFLAPEEPPPEELQLYIDGEPLDLSLVDWDRRVPELAGQVAYVPPVAVRTVLAARVTRDQIANFSNRGVDRLLLQTADGDSREFRIWGDRISWDAFLAEAP